MEAHYIFHNGPLQKRAGGTDSRDYDTCAAIH